MSDTDYKLIREKAALKASLAKIAVEAHPLVAAREMRHHELQHAKASGILLGKLKGRYRLINGRKFYVKKGE